MNDGQEPGLQTNWLPMVALVLPTFQLVTSAHALVMPINSCLFFHSPQSDYSHLTAGKQWVRAQ